MAGSGERLSPLPVERWSAQAHDILPRFLRRPERYLPQGPGTRPMPNAMGMLAHHPVLGGAWLGFTDLLASDQATLPGYLRELAIIRVAWRCRCSYEWEQHIRMAASVGIGAEELQDIAVGPTSPRWSGEARAVLQAADDLVDDGVVGDATWAALRPHFDDRQLLEIVFLIAGYQCFAAVADSVGLAIDAAVLAEPVVAPTLPATRREQMRSERPAGVPAAPQGFEEDSI